MVGSGERESPQILALSAQLWHCKLEAFLDVGGAQTQKIAFAEVMMSWTERDEKPRVELFFSHQQITPCIFRLCSPKFDVAWISGYSLLMSSISFDVTWKNSLSAYRPVSEMETCIITTSISLDLLGTFRKSASWPRIDYAMCFLYPIFQVTHSW